MTKANSKHWKSRPCAAKLKAWRVTNQKTYLVRHPHLLSQVRLGLVRILGRHGKGAKTAGCRLNQAFTTDGKCSDSTAPQLGLASSEMGILGGKIIFLFQKLFGLIHIPKAVVQNNLRSSGVLFFYFGF